MIKFTIDGTPVEAEAGKTVLEAALEAGMYIPNLCHHPDLRPVGACRLCIVEIDGMRGFPTSCTTTVQDGMVVHTNSGKVSELRRHVMWLILSELSEPPPANSQLKKVADWIGAVDLLPGHGVEPRNLPVISENPLFTRDLNACILCGRCVRICQDVRGVGSIGFVNRGVDSIVGFSAGETESDTACRFCTACVEVCPSGALTDKKEFSAADREKTLVPCAPACPAEIDIPRYVRLIAEERFQDAVAVIAERVPFAFVLGCVCPHPCEEACRRSELNEPIAIRELKRFVAENDTGEWKSRVKIAPNTNRKVAVIGSGPAGLTCAWLLKRLGHTVTVLEALPQPGGMMKAGIPDYRLPSHILEGEIGYIKNLGVEIKTNTTIESLDQVFDEGAEAVFLALGAMQGTKMGIPGEDNPCVLDGVSFLKSLNFGEDMDISGTIAVVGGGDVAIDVARSCIRLGAKKVSILYRRTRAEMPASPEEVESALEEGIEILFLATPVKIVSNPENLKIECIRMELGEPDASGRRRPVPIEGSEFVYNANQLIMAIGQKSVVPESFNIALTKRGRIEVDEETLSCSREGVFAGGDVATGPATVIEAIKAGRTAAASIDKYLGGSGEIDQPLVDPDDENPWLGRAENFSKRTRAKTPVVSLSDRLTDFREVEKVFDKDTATTEGNRCLRCQLRLGISPAPTPPEQQPG